MSMITSFGNPKVIPCSVQNLNGGEKPTFINVVDCAMSNPKNSEKMSVERRDCGDDLFVILSETSISLWSFNPICMLSTWMMMMSEGVDDDATDQGGDKMNIEKQTVANKTPISTSNHDESPEVEQTKIQFTKIIRWLPSTQILILTNDNQIFEFAIIKTENSVFPLTLSNSKFSGLHSEKLALEFKGSFEFCESFCTPPPFIDSLVDDVAGEGEEASDNSGNVPKRLIAISKNSKESFFIPLHATFLCFHAPSSSLAYIHETLLVVESIAQHSQSTRHRYHAHKLPADTTVLAIHWLDARNICLVHSDSSLSLHHLLFMPKDDFEGGGGGERCQASQTTRIPLAIDIKNAPGRLLWDGHTLVCVIAAADEKIGDCLYFLEMAREVNGARTSSLSDKAFAFYGRRQVIIHRRLIPPFTLTNGADNSTNSTASDNNDNNNDDDLYDNPHDDWVFVDISGNSPISLCGLSDDHQWMAVSCVNDDSFFIVNLETFTSQHYAAPRTPPISPKHFQWAALAQHQTEIKHKGNVNVIWVLVVHGLSLDANVLWVVDPRKGAGVDDVPNALFMLHKQQCAHPILHLQISSYHPQCSLFSQSRAARRKWIGEKDSLLIDNGLAVTHLIILSDDDKNTLTVTEVSMATDGPRDEKERIKFKVILSASLASFFPNLCAKDDFSFSDYFKLKFIYVPIGADKHSLIFQMNHCLYRVNLDLNQRTNNRDSAESADAKRIDGGCSLVDVWMIVRLGLVVLQCVGGRIRVWDIDSLLGLNLDDDGDDDDDSSSKENDNEPLVETILPHTLVSFSTNNVNHSIAIMHSSHISQKQNENNRPIITHTITLAPLIMASIIRLKDCKWIECCHMIRAALGLGSHTNNSDSNEPISDNHELYTILEHTYATLHPDAQDCRDGSVMQKACKIICMIFGDAIWTHSFGRWARRVDCAVGVRLMKSIDGGYRKMFDCAIQTDDCEAAWNLWWVHYGGRDDGADCSFVITDENAETTFSSTSSTDALIIMKSCIFCKNNNLFTQISKFLHKHAHFPTNEICSILLKARNWHLLSIVLDEVVGAGIKDDGCHDDEIQCLQEFSDEGVGLEERIVCIINNSTHFIPINDIEKMLKQHMKSNNGPNNAINNNSDITNGRLDEGLYRLIKRICMPEEAFLWTLFMHRMLLDDPAYNILVPQIVHLLA